MTKNEISLVEWQAFHNQLQHQLALPRKDREDPEEYIEQVKNTYNRLFEISPVCSQTFISATKKKIRKVATEQFQIPTWLNGFRHTRVCNNDGDEKYEENSVDV